MPNTKNPSIDNIRTNLRLTIAALYSTINSAASVTKEEEVGAFYEASVELLNIAQMIQDAANKASVTDMKPPTESELQLDMNSFTACNDKGPITLKASVPESGSTLNGRNLDLVEAQTMNVAELLYLGKVKLRNLFLAYLEESGFSANEIAAAFTMWDELTEMEQAVTMWGHYNPELPNAAHG
jgi:hypothetical protein